MEKTRNIPAPTLEKKDKDADFLKDCIFLRESGGYKVYVRLSHEEVTPVEMAQFWIDIFRLQNL